MNMERMRAILDKIREYDRIILFRHQRPDGDAVGATKGLCEILRLSFPEKEILVLNTDFSDYVAFLGGEDAPREDDFYKSALGIVIDTAVIDRISNPKYTLCRELIKIDHHIEKETYGDLAWVEEKKSSACEMIAEFYHTFRDELKINQAAASYIYAGMVTDSGRFRFSSVSGDTLRYAGMLLDVGVDTENLYSNLYLDDFNELRFKARILKKIKRTPNGVAHIFISKSMRRRLGMTMEQAGESVSHMSTIRGSLIWIAFIEADDGSIRVRLRSRLVAINELAERYHGGGHACASGATAHSRREMKTLLQEADTILRDYKKTHTDWL